MMKFPVPCNCISFDFLLLWLAYHWHFFPGMLKVYIIQLKGKKYCLNKNGKEREGESGYSSLLVPNKAKSSFLVLLTCQGWCHESKPVLSYLKKKKKQFNNLLKLEKQIFHSLITKNDWTDFLCNLQKGWWWWGENSLGKDLRVESFSLRGSKKCWRDWKRRTW